MDKSVKDRPLGKILHVIDGEAITRPDTPFIAKGARVVTSNLKEIGKLGNPFGSVDRPYQPIILNKKIDPTDIANKIVFAQIKK